MMTTKSIQNSQEELQFDYAANIVQNLRIKQIDKMFARVDNP